MKRGYNCICGDVSLALIASLGLSLGLGGQAFGQNCTNDAGIGDLPENESCALDENDDTVNGGCNSDPDVFTIVPALPAVYCGNVSNHNNSSTCIEDLECASACAEDLDCPAGDVCIDTDGDQVPDSCSGPGQATCDVPNGICVGGNEPIINRRDTDWYRVSAADLALADTDGNGVVQVTSDLVGEPGLDLVTFLIGIDLSKGADCFTEIFDNVGCWDSTGGNGGTQAANVVILSENPDGVVVFVAPGLCSGGGIFDGFECSTGINDYILTIAVDADFEDGTFLACGDPAQNPQLLPCNEENPGVPGCEDPACCKIVCTEFNPLCCVMAIGWVGQCVEAAVDLGCVAEPGGPVCLATGGDNTVDNYLTVCTDPYGSWTSDGFGGAVPGDLEWGDDYNPNGAEPAEEASFSNGFFFFVKDAQGVGTHRELLSNVQDWQGVFGPDATLAREITSDPPTVQFDDDGNGFADRLLSDFKVTGAGVDVSFHLVQTISQITPAGGSPVSVLEQTYTATNNSGAPITFSMVRHLDLDLVWAGSGFADDSVGTDTNDNPLLERHVSQGKQGFSETFITVSGELGGLYYGSKQNIDPDGDGPGPTMGFGTDLQQWESFGVPIGWENYIAGIGADVDGESGPLPLGIGTDGSIGLEFVVNLAGAGPASVQNIIVHTTYGARTPLGASIGTPCPWDCGGDNNGDVGIVDFLALLGQWAQVGTSCDFGLGDPGVGINEFLDLLGHWGPCP